MRNKLLIGAGILLTIFIVFLVIICAALSRANNTLPEDDLKQIIYDVSCDVKDEESIDYDMSILLDETQFNDNIQNKNYTKIKFNQSQNFDSLGIAFMVKANENCSLNFSLMKGDEVLKTTNVSLENGVVQDVNLTLENAVSVSANDEFYISINQTGESPFVFDTMLFFLSEE